MNPLYSHYVIDGAARELTPAQLLGDVEHPSDPEPVVDETLDSLSGGLLDVDPSRTDEYSSLISNGEGHLFPIGFPEEFTRQQIAVSLIDSLFREGNVHLEDMPLTLKWCADPSKIGNMSAFYSSVEAAVEYADSLGLSLRRHAFSQGELSLKVANPFSGAPLVCGSTFKPDSSSWIVYIPFDPSEYRLGGSLLSQKLGLDGGCAPQVSDPDYLMDCFELVREMVEDGVAIAGTVVGCGGLITALKTMSSGKIGCSADISDLMRATEENNPIRILFSEVPGVLIQIRDIDFDYIDAECLLQDIAFYPLGHPNTQSQEINIRSSAKRGIQNILDSLIQNAEGED